MKYIFSLGENMEEFEKLLTKKYKDVLYKNKTFKEITTFKIGGGIK